MTDYRSTKGRFIDTGRLESLKTFISDLVVALASGGHERNAAKVPYRLDVLGIKKRIKDSTSRYVFLRFSFGFYFNDDS